MNRGRGLGLTLGAVVLLAAGCSDALVATIALAAEQTSARVAAGNSGRDPTVDRTELRPYPIRVRGGYYVRMGAFDDREAARDLATELRRVTGEPVEVAEYGTGAGRDAVRLYRVLIGPAATRAGIVELVDALKGKGYGVPRTMRSIASETERRTPRKVAAAQETKPVGDGTDATRTAAPQPTSTPVSEEEVPSPAGSAPQARADDAVASAGKTEVAPSRGNGAGHARAPSVQVSAYTPQRRVKAFMVSEDGRRFLQMGAYAVRSTAEILASQLRLVTSEPVLVSEAVNNDGRSLHRVRIGPVGSDDALATLVDDLRPNYGTGWVLPSTPATSATRSTTAPRPIASTRPVKAQTTKTAWVVHGDSEYFVQVGAYAAHSWANTVASELSRQIDATVRVTEVSRDNGDPAYRVRIGPVTDDSLTDLVDALESLGYVVD